MSIILCPFDGTSKISGTRFGAQIIHDKFFKSRFSQSTYEIKLYHSPQQNSAIFCRLLHDSVQKRNFRLAIGGEHLITFPLLEVLQKKNPNICLIVFDAHHDAYPIPLLTHYSVFYYVIHELKIRTLFLGVRYEQKKAFQNLSIIGVEELNNNFTKTAKKIDQFIGSSPFYLSIDLDVLDPIEFSAVSSPVPNGLSISKILPYVDFLLKRNPIACDLSEYNPLKDQNHYSQLIKLEPLINQFKEWLSHENNSSIDNN